MNLEDSQSLVRWVLDLSPESRQERNLALLSAPPLIDLELAADCNIVCRFCPRAEMNRAAGLMSEVTFAAVERLLPPDAVVMFSGLGDSLLHPRLSEWVARLASSGHSSCLVTNGVRLTPTRQDALIAAGIAQLQVSLHSLDLDTARKVISRGAQPALVRQQLQRLATVRPSSLRVRLNFVETPDNEPDRAEVAAFAAEFGFDFFYRREHTRGGALGAGRAERAAAGCGIYAAVTFITADGDVLPCVNDVRGKHALGNARGLTWDTVERWKRRVIGAGTWFTACASCDDDYRWVLIGQNGLDEPLGDGPPGPTGPPRSP